VSACGFCNWSKDSRVNLSSLMVQAAFFVSDWEKWYRWSLADIAVIGNLFCQGQRFGTANGGQHGHCFLLANLLQTNSA